MLSGRLGELPMRVDDELVRNAGVEVLQPSGACSRSITLTLTILAMGSLSQSIACMSCRLYFSTGVWPVWREWDFAQPRFVRGGLPEASSDLATEYTRFKKS
jgi:hypothetical protein